MMKRLLFLFGIMFCFSLHAGYVSEELDEFAKYYSEHNGHLLPKEKPEIFRHMIRGDKGVKHPERNDSTSEIQNKKPWMGKELEGILPKVEKEFRKTNC